MSSSAPNPVSPAVARPFVKWAGGKGQLVPELLKRAPRRFDTYFEPFVGGGALFFALCPARAVLSDRNEELVNAYLVVQDAVEDLIESLRQHEQRFYEPCTGGAEYYYAVRGLDPATLSSVERASRLIFLNKTCYNGLWRENASGRFNVPFGRYKRPRILDEENLRNASAALRSVKVFCADFEEALEWAGPGSFVYVDPPYHPLSETASFTEYLDSGFGLGEQERLARVMEEVAGRGALVMISNSATDFTKSLYGRIEGFRVETVRAKRPINCRASGRGFVEELIVRNY